MLSVDFNLDGISKPTILCLGAHSDDIEIGALATILYLKKIKADARIVWVVLGTSGEREKEANASAIFCCDGFGEVEIRTFNHRDGYFPAQISEIKSDLESLKNIGVPDLVFTHYRQDAHQDHQLVSDLTWQTFRDQLILEYEIPKYDGDLGSPNFFCPISEQTRNEKLAVLERFFVTQQRRSWFNGDTFGSLMRLRGIECNSSSGYAEAFYTRKLVLGGRI